MARMRVLVTGGAGYIGSHLVDSAAATAGHDVARPRQPLDRQGRQHRPPARRDPLRERLDPGCRPRGARGRGRAAGVPPGRRGGRPPHRRRAARFAADQRPGHRERPRGLLPLLAQVLVASTSEVYGKTRQGAHGRGRRPGARAHEGAPLGLLDGQGARRAPRVRLRRPGPARRRSSATSTPMGPASTTAATARWSPASSAPALAERADHRARRRQAEPLLHLHRRHRAGHVPGRLHARGRGHAWSTSGNPTETTILELAERIRDAVGSSSPIELDSYEELLRARLRGHPPAGPRHHPRPRAARLGAAGRLDDGLARTLEWWKQRVQCADAWRRRLRDRAALRSTGRHRRSASSASATSDCRW